MVLLHRVIRWNAAEVVCGAVSHLEPANPLRRAGRLSCLCGIEYGLQAAAVHGALLAAGVAQPAGYAASLREVRLHAQFLDEAALGELQVTAQLLAQERFGMVYSLAVGSQSGASLLTARASIGLPR